MTISLEGCSSVNHLINEKQAAGRLGCTYHALRKWRRQGKGPKYIKVGRLVRYSEEDLAEYLDANGVEPMVAGGAQ